MPLIIINEFVKALVKTKITGLNFVIMGKEIEDYF